MFRRRQVPFVKTEDFLACTREIKDPYRKMFVASPIASVREAVKQGLGVEEVVSGATTGDARRETGAISPSPQPPEPDQTPKIGEDDKQALVELWALAGCGEVLTSVHSTFGYIAHAMAAVRPWVVSEGKQGCTRWETSAPCFHAYYKVARHLKKQSGNHPGSDGGTAAKCVAGWREPDLAAIGLRAQGCGYKAT